MLQGETWHVFTPNDVLHIASRHGAMRGPPPERDHSGERIPFRTVGEVCCTVFEKEQTIGNPKLAYF